MPNLQPMAWRLADVANQRSLINVPFGDEPSPRHALLGWHGFQAAYRVAQSIGSLKTMLCYLVHAPKSSLKTVLLTLSTPQ